MRQLWQSTIANEEIEDCQRHHQINVGSALVVGEATIKLKIAVIKVLNVISATRLDTYRVCVDQLQLTQTEEILNMLDGSKSPHNRAMMLTAPFSSFREIS